MKKKFYIKKLTRFPSSLHMSNEGEKKTLTSIPSRSTVKKINPLPLPSPFDIYIKKTHAPPP
jgi:hypothetical protein